MAFRIDENGDITLIQGDSGSIVVEGLNTDKNYAVYFAVQDRHRKPVASEILVNSNGMSSVIFQLTGEYTDLLKVDSKKKFEVYFYGIKVCDAATNFEDTVIIGEGDIGRVNTILVFPKKVEGI